MIDQLLEPFMLRALLGGLGVALMAGVLGCFVVWRRMAYFGDTLSHAALLGIALGLALEVNLTLAVIVMSCLLALALVLLQRRRDLGTDTALGILSHAALACGLIAISFMEKVRFDLMGYLFGDILAISQSDLWWIWGGTIALLAIIAALWRPLLASTVEPDIARIEGLKVESLQLLFMLLLAIVVALAMKVVGLLLITALLIIPAATARRLSKTPEQMALLSALIGAAAVVLGLLASRYGNLPAGPSVVAAATVLFLLSRAR